MFTGIIRAIGEITASEPSEAGLRMAVATSAGLLGQLAPGGSVALSGVCITVAGLRDGAFESDVVEATVARTTIGGWRAGHPVNLEPALRANDELGGHFVQGHVDGVGEVRTAAWQGDSGTLEVLLPTGVEEASVARGSLAIDGVSLTVNRLAGGVARFAIVPYTWKHTTLGRLSPGARVNVEADVIGKYVLRALQPYAENRGRTPSDYFRGSVSRESDPRDSDNEHGR